MQIHASCGACDGAGVLLLGPPGSGKSDLLLRLLDIGFALVADDCVLIEDGFASAPASLAGLLEVRGLGILRLPSVPRTRLRLVVTLQHEVPRLPEPRLHAEIGLPLVALDPRPASAARRVALALDCVQGTVAAVAGAFGEAVT
jgi:HPr kinase/phosphorylase